MEVICYGIIPIRYPLEFLLVHHTKGHWAFPKGHPENGESPIETAQRELFEETGLHVDKIDTEPFEEHYSFEEEKKTISKTVGYFVAEVSGMLALQEEEIIEAQWLSFDKALPLITFEASRQLLITLNQQLLSKKVFGISSTMYPRKQT